MKRPHAKTMMLFALICIAFSISAQEPEWSGFVSADRRIGLHDVNATYAEARVALGYTPADRVFLHASTNLRYFDLPSQERLPPTPALESGYHSDVSLWEAYLALDAFLWRNLDIRVGKQRIAWGRADRFNPTDNLNPDDFTDPFDFGAKVPSWSALATYFFGDSQLTGIWTPDFEPANFARGGVATLLGTVADDVVSPSHRVINRTFALKFSSVAFNLDYSISYLRGVDDLPILVRYGNRPQWRFPGHDVFGFDFAGEAGSVGFRGEFAWFRPDSDSFRYATLSGRAYLKYTLGVEYTFASSTFVEAEFVHGIIVEHDADNLGDFIVLTLKQPLHNNDVNLSISAIHETRTGVQGEPLHSTALLPEATYSFRHGLELSAGAYLLGGNAGTLLGQFKAGEQVFLKATFLY